MTDPIQDPSPAPNRPLAARGLDASLESELQAALGGLSDQELLTLYQSFETNFYEEGFEARAAAAAGVMDTEDRKLALSVASSLTGLDGTEEYEESMSLLASSFEISEEEWETIESEADEEMEEYEEELEEEYAEYGIDPKLAD